MKTCIITPTWNNEEYTIRCFASVIKSTKDYHIIWVDNGSSEAGLRKVKDFLDKKKAPYTLISNEDNLGFVKGTNQGMQKALELDFEYMVFLNNDTEVFSGWLDGMIQVAESNLKIGIVGPLASPSHGWQDINNLRTSRSDEFSDLPEYSDDPAKYSAIIKNRYKGGSVEVYPNVAFFCTLIKREVIDKIGLLSEDYGLGLGDDDDYCSRALDAGYKIYLAKEVFIFHNHRTTFKANFSEEEIKEMGKKNVKTLKEKHRRYKDLLDLNFSSPKFLLKSSAKIIKREGIYSFLKTFCKSVFYKIKYRKINFIK